MENTRLVESVSETKKPSSLKMRFDCGLGDNGRTIVKSRTYSNLKPDAAALDVYQHSILEIVKQDTIKSIKIKKNPYDRGRVTSVNSSGKVIDK